jgi:hypothetical protein
METVVQTTTPVPMPADWVAIHVALTNLWQSKDDPSISEPPVPLILAGAAFSSATAIRLTSAIETEQWSADLARSCGSGVTLTRVYSLAGVSAHPSESHTV